MPPHAVFRMGACAEGCVTNGEYVMSLDHHGEGEGGEGKGLPYVPKFITKKEAAAILGCSEREVDRRAQIKWFTKYKDGHAVRFDKREILAHLAVRFKPVNGNERDDGDKGDD